MASTYIDPDNNFLEAFRIYLEDKTKREIRNFIENAVNKAIGDLKAEYIENMVKDITINTISYYQEYWKSSTKLDVSVKVDLKNGI